MPFLATCTTLRSSLPQTLQFVYYHLNTGIDRMYLFFDDPEDPAIAILDQERRVVCIRCTVAHWQGLTKQLRGELSVPAAQVLNTTLAIQYAHRDGCEWLSHIDSDELLYSPEGIKKVLEKVPADIRIIKLATLESVPSRSDLFSFNSAEMFKYMYPAGHGKRTKRIQISKYETLLYYACKLIYLMKKQVANLLGVYHPFKFGFIKGHNIGKNITRIDADIAALQCHFPVVNSGVLKMLLFSNSFILHYDTRSYEQWRKKSLLKFEDSGLRDDPDQKMRPDRIRQFNQFMELYKKGDEAGLRDFYNELFHLQPKEFAVLDKLGLLRRINLPPLLFEKPAQ